MAHERDASPGHAATPIRIELRRSVTRIGRWVRTYTWNVRLPVFEGPLALLLYLVKRQRIPIEDVPIARLADEYLAYLHALQEYRLDIAAEFLVMAARLLWLKSLALLPHDRGPSVEERKALEDKLRTQIRSYRELRRAARWLYRRLREQEELLPGGTATWFDPDDPPTPVQIAETMARLAARRYRRASHRIRLVVIRIEDHFAPLRQLASRRRTFQSYLRRLPTRGEQSAAFAALVHLVHTGQLMAEQTRPFGPIRLRPAASGDSVRVRSATR